MNKPSVYMYQNLLSYLKEVYKYKKKNVPGFSYELWAQEMGIKSRSYLRAVINSQKPLQENILPCFLRGLNLSKDEETYFTLLFKYHHAPESLKNIYLRDIFNLLKIQLETVSIQEMDEFLSDSLLPVLFTYLTFDEDGIDDLSQAAADLNCSMDQIHSGLRCLIWSKLVETTEERDQRVRYKAVAPYFKVPAQSGNASLKKFHQAGLEIAAKATHLPSEARKMYATFIALDAEQFIQAQDLIRDFNQRLLQMASKSKDNKKIIYRLNQQIFPVSQSIEPKPQKEPSELE